MPREGSLDPINSYQTVNVAELELELHGIFWFHTYAQPRDKYAHISLPVIHNYPLTLALLGVPVEQSYASVSGLIARSMSPASIWEEHGFYVYPAIVKKALSRTLTFSMGGTGYAVLKPKTRASVPDYTLNQVFLPGSMFKTYILVKPGTTPYIPKIIRLGAKRFGVFRVRIKSKHIGRIAAHKSGQEVTHPYNAEDCPSKAYYGILRHYAGCIAFSGIPEKIISAGDIVLASPSFL